tara:strand:+ start:698 stop:1345 length:648 start_codon:yes stop_codon:yes gene_type:complete
MSFAIIIPAQEKNRYHDQGDLAPFGQTTLLEWKIAQCKEFVELSQINICSDSEVIKEIAQKEGINYIKRKTGLSYKEMIFKSIEAVDVKDIILINTTSPFIGSKIYKNMYDEFKSKKLNSLISVEKKNEYIFFEEKKFNFKDNFTPRENVKPIYIATNGCYIFNRDFAINNEKFLSSNPSLFPVDSFTATEIKDIKDYKIAREMITMYFQEDLDV